MVLSKMQILPTKELAKLTCFTMQCDIVEQGWLLIASMQNLLEGNGLSTAGQTALFTLLELPDAGILHRKLARKGIWTRVFPEQKRWLRMGLPGAEPDWQRLETALLSKE